MPVHQKIKFQPKIVLLGAGRVATAFAKRLAEKNCPPAQIFNRTAAAAQKLAAEIGCRWTSDFSKIDADADLYILAVRDDSIEFLAENLSRILPLPPTASPNLPQPPTPSPLGEGEPRPTGSKKPLPIWVGSPLVIHLSGATPRAVLEKFFKRNGVCWPLQTFSLDTQPDWRNLPICTDAASDEDLKFLKKFVQLLGANFFKTSDEQRAQLHVAAVFANNFTNHCLAIAEKLLADADLSPTMLRPLVAETFEKFAEMSPREAQTGPARRGDSATLERHILLLENDPLRQKIYELMSESISDFVIQEESDRQTRHCQIPTE